MRKGGGSAPTFVTEDNDRVDDFDGDGDHRDGADDDANEDEDEEVRVGLGSSGRAGIGGGKQQQQQSRVHQPITSNAAFAASLYQVRRVWACHMCFGFMFLSVV